MWTPPLCPPDVIHVIVFPGLPSFSHSSASVYYTDRKLKNENGVGLGTRLLTMHEHGINAHTSISYELVGKPCRYTLFIKSWENLYYKSQQESISVLQVLWDSVSKLSHVYYAWVAQTRLWIIADDSHQASAIWLISTADRVRGCVYY